VPDFTVIDGGGTGRPPPEDLHQRRAAEAMRILVIELLRAVARGDDPEKRVLKGPRRFVRLSGRHDLITQPSLTASCAGFIRI
jgi:hypothetical protein